MRVFLNIVLLLLVSTLSRAETVEPLYGFTAFPYDLSVEAIEKTYETVLGHSSFFPLHLDDCVPWHALLSGTAIPQWVLDDWRDTRRRVGKSRPIYIAITPTGTDRRTIAPACGKNKDEKRKAPRKLRNISFDSALFQKIYLAYAEKVIRFFDPRFINIGIEMSELSLSHPNEWQAFENLYRTSLQSIKRSHPQTQVGIEFVLQSIMTPRVGQQMRPAVEISDFICISFYPYGSAAGVAQGAVPLPKGRAQWRKPLKWLREYTDKPLAVCETGYASRPFTLNIGEGIAFEGNLKSQALFLEDMVKFAKRDNYLFVVWFTAIDYDRLLDKMPDAPEWFGIWKSTGLYDRDLKPKPAWRHWPLSGSTDNTPITTSSLPSRETSVVNDNAVFSLGYSGDTVPFTCAGSAQMEKAAGSEQTMTWPISYEGDWTYCGANIGGIELQKVNFIRFRAKAKRAAPILVRLDIANGQSWYSIINIDTKWQDHEISLSNFIHSEGSKTTLPKSKVVSIALADGAGADGEQRSQRY